MIKRFDDLTEEDKNRFLEVTKSEYESKYKGSWSMIEKTLQTFINNAYNKELFDKMSKEDKIDAFYMLEKFPPNRKPSIAEHILWASTLGTGSDYVYIPD